MARSGSSSTSSSVSSSFSCFEVSSSIANPPNDRPKSAPARSRRRLQDDVEAAAPEVAIAAEHFDVNPIKIKMSMAKGLPAGWVACQAEEGEVYYHCSLTGVSQWAHPGFTEMTQFKTVGKALRDGKLEDSEPPTQHSVYDARSRHVELATPESLFSDNVSSGVVREDLLPRVFALHNLLTKTEAASYVESAVAHGFHDSDVAREFPIDVRNNSRLIHFSNALAVALWRRLAPQLLHRDIFLIQPMGYAAEGRWKPVGVNGCFRISRYNEREHFAAHRDGMYVDEHGESSIYSIVLYLNEDFDGGELELPHETIFQPRAGTALFFPHDTWHTARAPTRGTKYVVRSELMFRCVDARPVPRALKFVSDPLFQRMAALYAQIGDLAVSGDAAKTTATYQEALGIQIAHKGTTDAATTDAKLPLPGKVLAQALYFLSPKEVLATTTVSSSWHMVTTAGLIWIGHCQQRWPRSQDVIEHTFNKFDPELKDWLGLYRRLHLASKSAARVCTVFLSDKLEAGTNAGEAMTPPVPARAVHRESGEAWDSSVKQRRGWSVGVSWGASHSWFEDKVANWQMLPELFKHAYHCLGIDPSSHRLLIPALPGVLSKLEKARLVRILMGRFHIPKICIAPAPLCALLAHNLSTGTVIWGCSMGTSVVSCYIHFEEVTVVGPFHFHSGTPEDIAALVQQAAANLGEEKARQVLEHVVLSTHGPAQLKKSSMYREREKPKEEEKGIPPAWISVDRVKKLLPFGTEVHAHMEGDVVAGGTFLAGMPELLTAFEVEPEINPRDETSWEWRLLADGKWYKLPAYCAGVLESALRNGKKNVEIQLGTFFYLVADLDNFTIGISGRMCEPESQRCRLTRFMRGHPSSIPDTRIPEVVEGHAEDRMQMAIVEEVSDVEALHVRTMAGRVVLSIAKNDVHKIGASVQELQEEVSDRCCVSRKQVTLLHEGRTLESTEALQPMLKENLGAMELLLLVGEKPVAVEEHVNEVMPENWPGEDAELDQLCKVLGYW